MQCQKRQINIQKSGCGKALVLFHGWGFDHKIFLPMAKKLAQSFTLYLVDLPGFGETSFMPVEDFFPLLFMSLPNDFSVIGWSLGGLYAIKMSLEYSSRINKLLVMSSSPYFLMDTDWPGVKESVLLDFYQKLQENPIKTLEEFIMTQTGKNVLSTSINASSEGLKYGLDCLLSWDFREALRNRASKTFFLCGRLDAIIPRHIYPVMKTHYPAIDSIMFSHAAHAPFLSHEHETITWIKACLL